MEPVFQTFVAEPPQNKPECVKILKEAENQRSSNMQSAMDLLDEVSKQLGNVREDAAGNKTNVTGTIASDVQEMQYLTKRGNIQYELQEYEEALRCFKDIWQHPTMRKNCKVFQRLGNCSRKLADFNNAEKYYTQGLKLAAMTEGANIKEEIEFNSGKTLLMIAQNKFDLAFKSINTCIKLDSSTRKKGPNGPVVSPLYQCQKAEVQYKLGNQQDADKELEKVISMVDSGVCETLVSGSNLIYVRTIAEKFKSNK